ncbi:MAG: RnfABCDGE type electron transport complex subunit D [Oscillospiraceae bacterium]|nr:RnfABCDGE type electron transport complex subunit D [Oscillospiraceae bacterium]
MSEATHHLIAASSPHVGSSIGTRNLMRDVIIALIPALCIGVYFFGPRALIATIISVAASVFFEWAYRKLMKKSNTVGDLSAVITGILLAFVCPVTLPYWILIIGDFFAIIVVKQLFGGLGKNFINPALGARAFLMLCYPSQMTTWASPGPSNWAPLGMSVSQDYIDAFTGATPLSSTFMHKPTFALPDGTGLWDMFVGNIGGCIGEVSALLLIVGAIYLLCRGVIRIRIPAAFILTVAVLSFIFPLGGNGHVEWMLYQVLGGGLMIGAFFMATDYTTSPVTKKGEWIYGIGCGLLTVFIRYFGAYPEGVSYAILLMNVCVWLIDKYGQPRRFGVSAEMRKAEKAAKGGAGK